MEHRDDRADERKRKEAKACLKCMYSTERGKGREKMLAERQTLTQKVLEANETFTALTRAAARSTDGADPAAKAAALDAAKVGLDNLNACIKDYNKWEAAHKDDLKHAQALLDDLREFAAKHMRFAVAEPTG